MSLIITVYRSKKTKTETVSKNVETVERNAITIPREIPVILHREKTTSPLSASSHTADGTSSTKGKMTDFDTPTKALIHYVFDDDNNDDQTSKNFPSPKVLKSYHHHAMSHYFSPFTPIAKANDTVLQTTWTPLDKSASVDCSLMLELDSLEISSTCDIAINTRKTNEVHDTAGMLDNTSLDQGIDCDRTPIVARAKRKFESHSYDDLHHPRSAPCQRTKLSDYYDCPKSVSVYSDPCRYIVKSHDGLAELDTLNINVGTSFYQPKKRSSCENKPCTQFHEEITLNIEADDYFDFGEMDSNLEDFFQ